jgi:hypothetical protein
MINPALFALGLALAMHMPFDPQIKPAIEDNPRDIYLACGSVGHWATIARFNKSDRTAKGYDPSYTVIFCKYKPMFKKVGDVWQITFTSEIAEDIP